MTINKIKRFLPSLAGGKQPPLQGGRLPSPAGGTPTPLQGVAPPSPAAPRGVPAPEGQAPSQPRACSVQPGLQLSSSEIVFLNFPHNGGLIQGPLSLKPSVIHCSDVRGVLGGHLIWFL